MIQHYAIDNIVGHSAWTEQVRNRIMQIADHRYSVLISGPSGTGKELIARAIHTHGKRVEKPFIPVNCAAIPSGLFSSQLFGHVKGAFTGAEYSSLGCFRAADGGTIFLDEIGELDLECQAKLLRVLQERLVVPVGSHDGNEVDVRILAATNRNLAEEVRAGRFRLDLYYRLNVLSVETLGLKDRVEDVENLATYFLAKTATDSGLPLKQISPAALALLQSYSWPGNVRELQNMIERAVVFTEGDVIRPEAFAQISGGTADELFVTRDELSVENASPESPPKSAEPANFQETISGFDEVSGNWLTLVEIEKQHIRKTLEETFYNQSAAARLLGVDRKLLARKIKKYGIVTPKTRSARLSQSK